MDTKHTDLVSEAVESLEKNNVKNNSIDQIQNINSQVKAVAQKTVRRKFSKSDKLKIIKSFEAFEDTAKRGEFLRKNGLYSSSITKWKREFSEKNTSHANSKSYKAMLAQQKLQRENTQLKKKLSQAEAIIDIQKKVSQLLSINILDQDMSEV